MDTRGLKQESVGLVVICLTERVSVKWNQRISDEQ